MEPAEGQHTAARSAIENPASHRSTVNTGTLYLVFIQIASRLLTFLGNQILLRYLSPSLLGLAVQLELLSVTILYTSRESLRVALQRQPTTSDILQEPNHNSSPKRVAKLLQQNVNLAYLTLGVGCVASCIFGYGYLQKSGDEVLQAKSFWLAFQLYGLATFIELLSEPCFVIIQQTSMFKARARAETGAAIARCLSACMTAFFMQKLQIQVSVLPFAVGQLLYAVTLLSFYVAAVVPVSRVNHFSLAPRKLISEQSQDSSSDNTPKYLLNLFSKPLLNLTTTFYTQSLFKLLLTQGDSLVISLVADLKAQGAFALASNYGGLLSRLLFQPVEESSRNVFGRLLSIRDSSLSQQTGKTPSQGLTNPEHAAPNQTTENKELTSPQSNSPSQSDTPTNIDLAVNHLTTTLHLYTLFSLPLLALLPHIFPILITNLIGTRWSTPETANLLSAYAYYLPFLAINGILDAFVTSVATPSQLRSQSLIMLAITTIYGISALTLMSPIESGGYNFGPAGLVWANILNMTLRIAYSVQFISRWITKEYAAEDKQKLVSLKWASMPHLACTSTAGLVAGYLIAVIQVDAKWKSFLGVKGLDVTDWGYLSAGGIVLLSSIIAFEYRFLQSILLTALPQRFSSKIAPYLPKQKKQ